MIEKQNDLKEVIVHLRTPSGAPAGPKDLSGKCTNSCQALSLTLFFGVCASVCVCVRGRREGDTKILSAYSQ